MPIFVGFTHTTRHLQNFALGMGMIADRLVRSTVANAKSWTARPEGKRPNNNPCLVVWDLRIKNQITQKELAKK